MRRTLSLATAIALAAIASTAIAEEEEDTPEHVAIEMRQGHMLNYAANLSVLGGMAQGNAEYDAAAAQTAADNLAHLAMIDWDYYWLEGTSSEDNEDSGALPAIWEDMAGFEAKHAALTEAATAMQAAAGVDLASLQGAMQAVGQACGGCHEAYRAKED